MQTNRTIDRQRFEAKNKCCTINIYGLMGVLFYYLLSIPQLRHSLFGEGITILSRFDGSINEGLSTFHFLGQITLLVPFYANEYIFKFFDIGNLNILVLIIFTPIVYRYFSYSKTQTNFLVLSFLFMPVPLIFLSTFTKEVLLIFFLYLSYGIVREGKLISKGKYFFAYSLLMKPYLIWIPLLIKNGTVKYKYLVSAILMIVVLSHYFPLISELFFSIFNRRMEESSYIANSEINQTVYVQNIFDVVLMYIEVIPQIYFSFLDSPGIKTFYFQIYTILLIYLLIKFKNIFSLIFVGLLTLHTALDPDLGAFFRHISTFFIFYPYIMELERHK